VLTSFFPPFQINKRTPRLKNAMFFQFPVLETC